MTRFIGRRLGQSLLVLLGATVVVFTLIHLVPGDPVRVGLGPRFTRWCTPPCATGRASTSR